jgi:hypothetical protein
MISDISERFQISFSNISAKFQVQELRTFCYPRDTSKMFLFFSVEISLRRLLKNFDAVCVQKRKIKTLIVF